MRYVVKAHGKYLGEVLSDSLWAIWIGPFYVKGWVKDPEDALLFERRWDAERASRKYQPCASVVQVSVQDASE